MKSRKSRPHTKRAHPVIQSHVDFALGKKLRRVLAGEAAQLIKKAAKRGAVKLADFSVQDIDRRQILASDANKFAGWARAKILTQVSYQLSLLFRKNVVPAYMLEIIEEAPNELIGMALREAVQERILLVHNELMRRPRRPYKVKDPLLVSASSTNRAVARLCFGPKGRP